MGNERRKWACEAYGPELDRIRPEHAPHCFWGEIEPCQVQIQCRVRMNFERERVYARLVELAAQGEGYAWMILDDVNGPEDLLRGDNAQKAAPPAAGDSPSGGPIPPD
jgi:hypothetical protein